MADNMPFTVEQQVALVNGAQERMDANASAWLGNAKVKSALLRERPSEECKEAS